MGWPRALATLLGGCASPAPATTPPASPPVVEYDPGERLGSGAPRLAVALASDQIAVATALGVGVWVQGEGAPRWFAETSAPPDSLSATPDGALVGAVADGWVHVWRDGAETYAARTDGAAVALAPDGERVAYSAGGVVLITRLDDEGEAPLRLGPLGPHVAALGFAPDGERLAGVDRGGVAAVWGRRGEAVARLEGRSPSYLGLAWSPDGRQIALAGSKSALWSPGGGLTPLEGPLGPVEAVAFSADGARIALGAQRGGLVECDRHTGARRAGEVQGSSPVRAVSALGEGWLAVSGTVSRWTPESGLHEPLLPTLEAAYAVALGEDGAAALMSPTALLLRAPDAEGGALALGLSHGPRRLTWSPRGQVLAVTARELLLATAGGETIYRHDFTEIYAADLRADGGLLAVAVREAAGPALRWLDGRTGLAVAGPSLDVQAPRDLRFSPDGTLLALLDGGAATVVEVATGRTRGRLSDAEALAWAPDGRLAVAQRGGGVQVWSGDTFALWAGRAAGDTLVQLAWSPDSGALAVLGQDTGGSARLTLLDAADGRARALAGVGDVGHAIGFSPDGGLLFALFGTNPQADGAKPGLVVAWDRQGWEHRRWPNLSRQDWWSLAVSPAGLLMGSGDGTGLLWTARR